MKEYNKLQVSVTKFLTPDIITASDDMFVKKEAQEKQPEFKYISKRHDNENRHNTTRHRYAVNVEAVNKF